MENSLKKEWRWNMELDNRKKRILQAIVNEYVDTIEPVS